MMGETVYEILPSINFASPSKANNKSDFPEPNLPATRVNFPRGNLMSRFISLKPILLFSELSLDASVMGLLVGAT